MYSTSDYDYELPENLIAQTPADRRHDSRLLALCRDNGRLAHHRFGELDRLLLPGDVLVINDTRVIPGRLIGRKATGGRAEVLLIDYAGGTETAGGFECQCLVKAAKPSKPGTVIHFDDNARAEVIEGGQGVYRLKFHYRGTFLELLDRFGQVPLPPYINRRSDDAGDRSSYQTVFAARNGAVAAPTAGLHFTRDMMARLADKGVAFASLTLHVSYGTFLPVRVTDIRDHRMHAERFQLSPTAADTINSARAKGGRVIAVGTTSVRTLEFCTNGKGRVTSQTGVCDLFIYPGYRFKAIDAMITNFHLPRSTLLMLVSAFAGRDAVMSAYETAIAEQYRFYSYGDAMLIY